MKYIKEYLCDDRVPSNEDVKECLEIVNNEDCVVKLTWFVPYNRWYNLIIKNGMTFEDCKNKIPKIYGL